MRLIATRSEQTKPALVHELDAAGATELTPAFRAVEFTADEALCYELNLRLRIASRDIRRRSRRRSPPRS